MKQEDKSSILGCSHIPALPGYAVAGLTWLDNKIHLEPIIAWALVTRHYETDDVTLTTIAPITLEGDHESNVPVVYPDGTVRIAHDCSFQTVQSWKDYATEKNESREAARPTTKARARPTAKAPAITELITEAKALLAALRGPELETALPVMDRLQAAIDKADKSV